MIDPEILKTYGMPMIGVVMFLVIYRVAVAPLILKSEERMDRQEERAEKQEERLNQLEAKLTEAVELLRRAVEAMERSVGIISGRGVDKSGDGR